MYEPPVPENEEERLKALYALDLLDTNAGVAFDRICRLTADLFQTPIAYVSLIDRHRQWYMSSCGLDMTETTRDDSFCAYTIAVDELVVVEDATKDDRFSGNPYVLGPPHVRFYLGQPLSSPDGYPVGTLCVLDFEPRPVNQEKLELLKDLGAMAEIEMSMRDMARIHEQLTAQRDALRKRNLFIRQVFGRYLTDEVAEKVLNNPDGWRLGGELREVTVLMSDLRGFTDMSSRLGAETVVSTLNRYLEKMVEIISRWGGTVDEIIGDAILVIFGAPTEMEDAPRRAVCCALEMQLAMEELNAAAEELNQPKLEMGIGINTGEVVVGNIGSERRMKYSVVGSPVNMAARIESCTVGGQILVSESTMKEVAADARVDGHLRVKMKGFGSAAKIYEIGGIGGAEQIYLPKQPSLLVGAGS